MSKQTGPDSVSQALGTVEKLAPVFKELCYRRDFVEKYHIKAKDGIPYGSNWLNCALYKFLLDNPDLKEQIEQLDDIFRKKLKDHNRLYTLKEDSLKTFLALHPDIVDIINDNSEMLQTLNDSFQKELANKPKKKVQKISSPKEQEPPPVKIPRKRLRG